MNPCRHRSHGITNGKLGQMTASECALQDQPFDFPVDLLHGSQSDQPALE